MGIKTEVKIDVSQLGLTLSPGTSYRIEVEEGFTKEDGGEEQPSPANTNLYSFTTNATGPVAQSGSSTVPNMKIKFDRKIFKNTGTIRLYKNGSTLVHTFDINDPTVTITYATGSATTANDALNVNLTGYITDGSTTYHLLADAGVVKDGDNFPSLAITSSSLADYSTGPAPLISTVYPTYNTVNFEDNTKVQLNFNSSILAGAADGSKLIRLYQSPSNTLVHAFDPDSNEVTISGSSAVIKTTGYLKANTEYYMTIDAGAFKTVGGIWLNAVGQGTIKFTTANATFPDLSAGLQSAFSATAEGRILPLSDYYLTTPESTTYIEDTVNAILGTPEVTEYAYTGTSNYSVTVTPVPANSIATLSSTGTGGSRSFNSTTKVLTLTGKKSAINSYLAGLTVKPAVDYAGNITLNYHVVSPTGIITDKSQALTIGTPLDTEVTNMINFDRTYTANQGNSIFASNTPYITDFDTAAGIVYQVNLITTIGQFSALDSGSDLASTWTVSGTKEEINLKLSQVKFYPTKDVSSNGTFTYQQFKNGVTQVSVSNNLLGTAQTLSPILLNLTSGSFTPTLDQIKYYKASILVVGGGGGGGHGGGGGGAVTAVTNQTLSYQTYPVFVGQGGAGTVNNDRYGPGTEYNLPGANGGSSTFGSSSVSINLIAPGGIGGFNYYKSTTLAPGDVRYWRNSSGGNSGRKNAYGTGGSGGISSQSDVSNTGWTTSGCGAGGGGDGGSATDGTYGVGTVGGVGTTISITGISGTYGKGGNGLCTSLSTNNNYGDGGDGAGYPSSGYPGQNGVVLLRLYP